MSKVERAEIRHQAEHFQVIRKSNFQPKLTRQEQWQRVKNFAEGFGIAWMIRKFF